MPIRIETRWPWLVAIVLASGCGGEPSDREVKNARAFEALLSAVSLKNEKEFTQDVKQIDERHAFREVGHLDGDDCPEDGGDAYPRTYPVVT